MAPHTTLERYHSTGQVTTMSASHEFVNIERDLCLMLLMRVRPAEHADSRVIR